MWWPYRMGTAAHIELAVSFCRKKVQSKYCREYKYLLSWAAAKKPAWVQNWPKFPRDSVSILSRRTLVRHLVRGQVFGNEPRVPSIWFSLWNIGRKGWNGLTTDLKGNTRCGRPDLAGRLVGFRWPQAPWPARWRERRLRLSRRSSFFSHSFCRRGKPPTGGRIRRRFLNSSWPLSLSPTPRVTRCRPPGLAFYCRRQTYLSS